MLRVLLSLVLVFTTLATQAQTKKELSRSERKEKLSQLTEAHHQFLIDVEPIILQPERDTFLMLETEAQRDLYIEDFWARRDPVGSSPNNRYRAEYYARLPEALQKYKHRTDDRFRIYMIQGIPDRVFDPDCRNFFVPMEVWEYSEPGKPRTLLFYAPGGYGELRLWIPHCRENECLYDLVNAQGQQYKIDDLFFAIWVRTPAGILTDRPYIERECSYAQDLLRAILDVKDRGMNQATVFAAPKIDEEKLSRFLRSNVLATENAPKLDATMSVAFPGKRRERTEVEITLAIPTAKMTPLVVGENRVYLVDVTGEVLKDGRFFERFRYRFDFPSDSAGEKVVAPISRFLRSASYNLRIKVVNPETNAESILEQEIAVPEATAESVAAKTVDDAPGADAQLRILPLPDSAITGFRKIETIVVGDAVKVVEFYLDGKKMMVKRNPPFELELDFGPVPKPQRVRAVGLDAKGNVVDGDELAVNLGADRLRVRIVSPRFAKRLQGNVRVELDVSVPEGKTLAGVELFLNETRLATLYSEPFVQTIHLPADLPVGYLRAVARLEGEEETVEDLVFVNAPEVMQEVTVHLIELPTTVERDGHPVRDLDKDAFRVFDSNRRVEIVKFEQLRNLPLAIGLAIDSSASMRKKLGEAQKAASGFFRTVMTEKDKAFLVAFDERPHLVRQWTSTVGDLDAALAKIRTEESTSLWDAIVFSLYNYQQVKGQRALVVVTDGRDTSSRFYFDQTLEYAKRSGIPIYAIGLGIGLTSADVKFRLGRLAAETGGATFYVDTADQLVSVYAQIQDELRSQYLLGFYPEAGVKPGGEWRDVRVEVDGAKVRTVRGYYP